MNRIRFSHLFFGIIFILLLFWKIPVKKEVPFPGNLLTGRFFPWNSIKWDGYPTGVPYKEFIAADAVRQTYPFRELAIKQIKAGEIPWWNPYVMSGTPLLANLQSGALYPLNFIFLLTSFNVGWISLVVLQPVLAFVFMYLFLNEIKLTKNASLIGGLSFALSGYLLVWLELNTVGHAALWLPLMLWSLEKIRVSYKYFLVFIFAGICSIFANHIQSSLYALLFSIIFFGFNLFSVKKSTHQKIKEISVFILSLLVIVIVTIIQILPALYLLILSPRSGANIEIFSKFLLPFSHLVTFLIPNYFGNPATNNYFGKDYGEFMAYMGIVPVVFGLIFLFKNNKTKLEKFLLTSLIVCFVLALNTPIAYIPHYLKIPILESSAPSRILFLIQFLIAAISAFGIDYFFRQHKKLNYYLLILLFLILISLSFFAFYKWQFNTDLVTKTEARVSFRNSLFPILEIALISVGFTFYFIKKKKLLVPFLLVSMFFGYLSFMDKYLPFAPVEFMYPKNPLFSKVDEINSNERFFGDYTASVTSNIWMIDNLYGVEGYDSLYIGRYGQLLDYANSQGESFEAKRSDANLIQNRDDFFRRRLQDILGVTYILDKAEFPRSNWDHDVEKFPTDRYELVWQEDQFKIYKNLNSLKRARLTPTYMEIKGETEILSSLFNPQIDLEKITILETEPKSSVWQKKPAQFDSVNLLETDLLGNVQITDYSPNSIRIMVSTPKEQILVLSDVYHEAWQAFLDGNQVPIMRANFVFRAVLIPPGEHEVEMKINSNVFEYLNYLKN